MDKKLYVDVEKDKKKKPFMVFIGGRGIGKTYSALRMCMHSDAPFIYMRNTDVQLKESSSAFGNPFKRINRDLHRDFSLKTEKSHSLIIEGNIIRGYAVALSTFKNLRGVDLSDVNTVVFDEFIEQGTLNFNQYSAFLNFYEVANRNRELEGEKPLTVYMLSNAQKLDNPILAESGISEHIYRRLILGNDEVLVEGAWKVRLYKNNEVSKAKAKTTLYKGMKEEYFNETINNLFAHDDFSHIGKKPLNEYYALCSIDGIYIYKHKADNIYYVCESQSQCTMFDSRKSSIIFNRAYWEILTDAIATDRVVFQSYIIKRKLLTILDI